MHYIKVLNITKLEKILKFIKKEFDKEFKNNDGLYDHIMNIDDKIITFGDHTICNSTILANINKNPNVKIIYISENPRIYPIKKEETDCLINVIDKIKDNIIFIGVVSTDDIDVYNNNLKYITKRKITPELLKQFIGNNDVHVCVDTEYKNVLELLLPIKNNIKSLDFIGFQDSTLQKYVKKINTYIRSILIKIFDVHEKKINIYNEQTEFLIYRPATQVDIDCDYGWYILTNIATEMRIKFLELVPGNSIRNIKIDGEEYLLAKTTMDEQNNKSIFESRLNEKGEICLPTIEDKILFQSEKIKMAFELLNTPNIE